jgi:hypothetical protein
MASPFKRYSETSPHPSPLPKGAREHVPSPSRERVRVRVGRSTYSEKLLIAWMRKDGSKKILD